MMAALLMAACGHRVSQGSTADTDSVSVDSTAAFRTDSIGLVQDDSMASVKVSIDWPVSGNDSMVNAIRQYICEELATQPYGEGKPEVKHYADGKTAVTTILKTHYDELSNLWKEARDEGMPTDMPYSYSIHVFKTDEGERYVTYLSNSEGFMGGAHGFAISTGITFDKANGQRIGYNTEYNEATERIEIKDQTMFANDKDPKLHAIIKEGVKKYFQEFDTKPMTDKELRDQLLNIEDVNSIPLPSTPPIFTSKGLCFTYQQYDIAPYAAGMPNFLVPYEQIRPLLTPEAARLIP